MIGPRRTICEQLHGMLIKLHVFLRGNSSRLQRITNTVIAHISDITNVNVYIVNAPAHIFWFLKRLVCLTSVDLGYSRITTTNIVTLRRNEGDGWGTWRRDDHVCRVARMAENRASHSTYCRSANRPIFTVHRQVSRRHDNVRRMPG